MILGKFSYAKYVKSKVKLQTKFNISLRKIFGKKSKKQKFLISIFEMFGFVHNLSKSNEIMGISDLKEK